MMAGGHKRIVSVQKRSDCWIVSHSAAHCLTLSHDPTVSSRSLPLSHTVSAPPILTSCEIAKTEAL